MENPEQNALAGLQSIPESADRQQVQLPEFAALRDAGQRGRRGRAHPSSR